MSAGILPLSGHDALTREVETTAALRPKPLLVLSDEEMQRRPKPEQVVEGMLLEKSTSALVGEPGSGKGLVLIDLFYRVAHGIDYYGHRTMPGSCVYVAMERQGGLGARIRAWKTHHHRPERADVYYVPQRFSLFDGDGASRLLEALEGIPGPVRFVGIDTTAKAMLPGEENATRDMGLFMGNLQRVAETGPNVLGVHHLNAAASRERGNTSFRGDVDTLMMVKNRDGRIYLECDKQNELETFAAIALRIIPSGESAVVNTAAAVNDPMLTKSQLEILNALRIVALGGDASASTWLKTTGLPDRTFYDGRSRLITRGYVTASKDKRPRYSLTLAGESAVTADCGDTADSLRPQQTASNCGHCGGVYIPPASAVQFSSNGRRKALEPESGSAA